MSHDTLAPQRAATAEMPSSPTPDDDVTAKKFRAFMIIWVAQLVARIGNGLTAFGLGVHVYQQSGLTTSVALVTMAAFLPALLLGPLGGVLADRFDRRLLMILGDSLSALGLVGMLLAFHTGTASVPVLCLCAAVSSVFSSVMDPAYRATVTDLLTPEQYARAGGLVQLAAASQYLISPAVAGLIMATHDITVVVTIDVATMVVTTSAMVLVWRTVKTPRPVADNGFWADFHQGCRFLGNSPGIMTLMLLLTLVTFCMGFLQTLLTPMVLDLSDETTLGIVRSVAAIGMVVASLVIGVFNMKGSWIGWLAWSLVGGGVVVFFMGAIPNVLAIGVMAFGFFLVLPPLNTAVEVLVRSAIPNDTQGKIWGLMGLISQLGYVAAYGISGHLADHVFNPLLRDGGALADSLGNVIGVGESRGIGFLFMIVGVLLVGIAALIPRARSVRALQDTLTTDRNERS